MDEHCEKHGYDCFINGVCKYCTKDKIDVLEQEYDKIYNSLDACRRGVKFLKDLLLVPVKVGDCYMTEMLQRFRVERVEDDWIVCCMYEQDDRPGHRMPREWLNNCRKLSARSVKERELVVLQKKKVLVDMQISKLEKDLKEVGGID